MVNSSFLLTVVPIILSVIAIVISIVLPVYLNKKTLRTPDQKQALIKIINILNDEIKENDFSSFEKWFDMSGDDKEISKYKKDIYSLDFDEDRLDNYL